ncbi:sulfatase-like hydrolase/transferase [Wohlfahrtiimonas chitiniclastica]|uniref:sulfatase-like hydrolase/transferase n=1 Tax=Wohlfahrtiimonas chitiniclastica TaxID=400946 RepID=UPI001BD0ABD0|nr:sulfatase-like hydrolase/transferase [Wohlfahrtiimonas chitiniclastica]MBS7820827.1 sulfatase-like hydrolase/transferase [Wohlfahrtiimonas chitiniclastica]
MPNHLIKSSSSLTRVKQGLFFIAIIIAALYVNPTFFNKLSTFVIRPGSLANKIISIGIFLTLNALFILFVWMLAKATWKTKTFFLTLIIISLLIFDTYYLINGSSITFFSYLSLKSSFSSIDDAVLAYQGVIVKSILMILPLCILIIFHKTSPKKHLFSFKNLSLLFCLQIGLIAGIVYHKKTGEGADGLPPGILAYAYEIDIGLQYLLAPAPQARHLNSESVTSHPFQNIVLIVDESIHADFINADTTPNLMSVPSLLNLGQATSYANCSQYSNILLRKMARVNHETEDANANYYIWDALKSAGYHSVLIDAQGGGRNHNFFTDAEINQIENINTSNFKNDVDTAHAINAVLSNGQYNFIYVIKKGAHFPFFNDDIAKVFTPTMQSSLISNESEEAIINSYKNMIRHNTDAFFATLNTQSPNTVFIYTSDHGQNLYNLSERMTHCTVESPRASEGQVPLVLFGDFKQQNFSHFMHQLLTLSPSHYLIPFMVLDFAGYSEAAIESLMNQPQSVHSFVHGNVFGFFGGQPDRTNI